MTIITTSFKNKNIQRKSQNSEDSESQSSKERWTYIWDEHKMALHIICFITLHEITTYNYQARINTHNWFPDAAGYLARSEPLYKCQLLVMEN